MANITFKHVVKAYDSRDNKGEKVVVVPGLNLEVYD